MDFITLNDKKVYVVDNELNLREKGIKEISEIIGLDKLTNLKVLNLYGNDITELKGLENLENLIRLSFGRNYINEIKGLESLKNLKILELFGNQIKEITNLESLNQLEELTLDDNQIEIIQGLKNLNHLKKLSLSLNKIAEIEGLENLFELEYLDLSDNNEISNLKGLGDLNKLTTLKIARTRISPKLIQDMGGLNENNGIVNEPEKWKAYCHGEYVKYNGRHYFLINDILRLENLGISDISEIKGLTTLKNFNILSLLSNYISELKGFGNLNNFKTLWLGFNRINKIKGLEHLVQLEELALNNNCIKEISGLDTLINLEVLSLNNNQINQIKNLVELKRLKKLDLSENQKIEKIEGLETLKDLKILNLKNNKILKIEGLKTLRKLEILNLEQNNITEINNISYLQDIKDLNLSKNQIMEIKGLENLNKIQYLNLNNNQINEIRGLENLSYLIELNIENNNIPPKFHSALKIPHSPKDPRWFISYCIIKPHIEKLLESGDGIIYLNELVEDNAILKNIHFYNIDYQRLKNILNLFDDYLEIQEDDERRPISIVSPNYLLKELNKLKIGNFYEYKDIPRYLQLHNEDSARNLIVYIDQSKLKPVYYNIEKGGIRINTRKGDIFKEITEHLKLAGIFEKESEDTQVKTWRLVLNRIALLSEQSFNKKNSFHEIALSWKKEKEMHEWFDFKFREFEKEHNFITYHPEADSGGGECEHFINSIPIEDKIVDNSDYSNIEEFLKEHYEKYYPQIRRYAIGKQSKYAILLITDKREDVIQDKIRASSPNKCLQFQYNEEDDIWCAVFAFQVLQKSPSQLKT